MKLLWKKKKSNNKKQLNKIKEKQKQLNKI